MRDIDEVVSRILELESKKYIPPSNRKELIKGELSKWKDEIVDEVANGKDFLEAFPQTGGR